MARKEILKAESKNFNFHYADGTHALKDINIPLYEKKITALIGPSGCGKSTFLRSFNRMHDLYAGNKYDGETKTNATRAYTENSFFTRSTVVVFPSFATPNLSTWNSVQVA